MQKQSEKKSDKFVHCYGLSHSLTDILLCLEENHLFIILCWPNRFLASC